MKDWNLTFRTQTNCIYIPVTISMFREELPWESTSRNMLETRDPGANNVQNNAGPKHKGRLQYENSGRLPSLRSYYTKYICPLEILHRTMKPEKWNWSPWKRNLFPKIMFHFQFQPFIPAPAIHSTLFSQALIAALQVTSTATWRSRNLRIFLCLHFFDIKPKWSLFWLKRTFLLLEGETNKPKK